MIGGFRAGKPLTPKVIWEAVQEAAKRAGIEKHVAPILCAHLFHSLVKSGRGSADIQMLLGHAGLSHTTVYLHLSQKHLRSAPNSLDHFRLSSTANVQRPRRRYKPE